MLSVIVLVALIVGMAAYYNDAATTYGFTDSFSTANFTSNGNATNVYSSQLSNQLRTAGQGLNLLTVFIIGNLIFSTVVNTLLNIPGVMTGLLTAGISNASGGLFVVPSWFTDLIVGAIALFFVFKLIQLAFSRQTEV